MRRRFIVLWVGSISLWLGSGMVRAISFPDESIRLRVGESQVISFSLESAAEAEVTYPIQIDPPSRVQVLQSPLALAGQKHGYFRVKALEPGSSTVQVKGARLRVVAEKGSGRLVPGEIPKLVSPVSGSAVWGRVAVGVEWVPPDQGSTPVRLQLKSSDGYMVEPDPKQRQVLGLGQRDVFLIDVDKWTRPVQTWRPIVVDRSGKVLMEGDAVTLRRATIDPEHFQSGECEDYLDGTGQERFGDRKLETGEDKNASGGKFVRQLSNNPPWALKTEIRKAGYYQMFVTARGEDGAGALPSLGIYVDEGDRTVTNSRIASREWQRTPVGVPFKLEEGERMITVQFRNDFYQRDGGDRNLYMDRYELAYVGDQWERRDDGVQVEWDERLAGQKILGPVRLRGSVRWPGFDRGQTPRVELWLNRKLVSSQRGAEPIFELPLESFRSGVNHVELRARSPNGEEVRSEMGTLTMPSGHGMAAGSAPRIIVYTVVDERWDQSMTQRWESRDNGPVLEAAFLSNGESMLRLPETLVGRFDVFLTGRGTDFEGPPQFEVSLRRGTGNETVGTVAMGGNRPNTRVGEIDLRGGAQELVVAFINDHYVEKKGDRNIWLRRVVLREVVEGREPLPPRLAITYPKPEQATSQQGLVLLDGFGIESGDQVDLLIGDRVVTTAAAPSQGWGPWYLPYGSRSLTEGEHVMQVVLRRRGSEVMRSEPVPFRVGGIAGLAPYDRAVHLLNRFGFGPEPEAVAEILVEGEIPWLTRKLLAAEEAGGRARGNPGDRALNWLQQTGNPVRARFVLWAQNHFSVWARKAGNLNKIREHENFVRLGVAPFKDLLHASATSPAMLVYLDQQRSFAKRLNENYARELLELHTLGVKGGYTQADVTAMAHLLTGWTLSEEADLRGTQHDLVSEFRFEPRLNATSAFEIFGYRFPEVEPDQRLDRVQSALEMLALHPQTAQFISRKIAEHYVGVPADEALVNDLAGVFWRNGGDMVEVLVALAAHPTFWASLEQPRMASPLDFGVRLSRMVSGGRARDLNGFLNRSGMGMFDRSTPDGYPNADASWADSNALLQRWRWAGDIQVRVVPSDLLQKPFAEWSREDRQRAIDATAMRVNGFLLRERSNDALLAWMDAQEGGQNEVASALGVMLMRLPETHMR